MSAALLKLLKLLKLLMLMFMMILWLIRMEGLVVGDIGLWRHVEKVLQPGLRCLEKDDKEPAETTDDGQTNDDFDAGQDHGCVIYCVFSRVPLDRVG